MKTLLITLAAATAFVAVNPVAAQGPTGRTAAVSTAGLDLSTERGQRALELRIVHASGELCGTPSSADPHGRAKVKECRAELQTSAAEQARILIARAAGLEVAAR
jgi:UrcA family protein